MMSVFEMFFLGSCSVKLASILYQLGPECAPSIIPQLKEVLTPIYLKYLIILLLIIMI